MVIRAISVIQSMVIKNQFCLLMSVGQRVSPSYFDQERPVIELKIWSLTIKNKINKKLTL